VSKLLSGQSAQIVEKGKVATVEVEGLAPDVLLGKQIFYNARDRRMSRDGYLSCAVCHLDGEHDGRTWDFTDRGEGLRNTTTLLGKRGIGQGRLHWTANFDEVQDFEHDIRNAFKGKGFMADEVFHSENRDETLGGKKTGLSPELDAIDAYLTSLDKVPESPYRNGDGTFTEDAKIGKLLFEGLACDKCHFGPDMTDSADGRLHDVGTLRNASGQRLGGPLTGLDTPTLVGTWATGPYLHEGSAATLAAVLDKAIEAGDAHGDVKRLSAAQQGQLVEYLLELDGSIPEAGADEVSMGCACSLPAERGSGAKGNVVVVMAGLMVALALHRRRRNMKSFFMSAKPCPISETRVPTPTRPAAEPGGGRAVLISW
jgi:MYXO-CTERM domain-containing protein